MTLFNMKRQKSPLGYPMPPKMDIHTHIHPHTHTHKHMHTPIFCPHSHPLIIHKISENQSDLFLSRVITLIYPIMQK